MFLIAKDRYLRYVYDELKSNLDESKKQAIIDRWNSFDFNRLLQVKGVVDADKMNGHPPPASTISAGKK